MKPGQRIHRHARRQRLRLIFSSPGKWRVATSHQLRVIGVLSGLLPQKDVDRGLLTWRHGHPQLYLNVFSRELDSLYVLGFVEFADAAYQRFDEMAQLVMIDVNARETGVRKDELTHLKRTDRPDLRGGVAYVDSPRHANYVERTTYMAYLADFRDRFGWHDVDHRTYESLRVAAAAPTGPAREPSRA
jgi:hypothetical protein